MMIKDFLIQITLIGIPIFTYHTFIEDRIKNDKQKKMIISSLWGISVILCMSFPISFGLGYRYDLRLIPILLGTLYNGLGTGLVLSFFVVIYRSFFGIDIGFYHSILVLLFCVPVILLFEKSFQRAGKRKRIRIAFLLSCYYSMMVYVWFFILNITALENFKLMAEYIVFVGISTLFFITLNENIREINEFRLQTQNSEKLRVLSDLSSVFAHEIRNPIQVVRGFLQLMNDPDIDQDKKSKFIQISVEELDRANEIITDFLSFSKPQNEIMDSLDISNQLKRIVNILETYALAQNVSIQVDVDEDCIIFANEQKLKQCLINILKNGIEAMPNGGILKVHCRKKIIDIL